MFYRHKTRKTMVFDYTADLAHCTYVNNHRKPGNGDYSNLGCTSTDSEVQELQTKQMFKITFKHSMAPGASLTENFEFHSWMTDIKVEKQD
jgi:hypothetical protein